MITRNNYEEYFLLYIDNELSPEERRAVERFVHDNSDLAPELVMMQQLKLQPEKIYFEGRESLLKPVVVQGASINHTNYEEYFVLYADGELNDAAKKEVDAFIADHPSLQSELELFALARIHPDTSIVFEEKEWLYKKEEPKKRAAIPWYRIAAAAILLLVAGFLVFRNSNKELAPATARVHPAIPGVDDSPAVKPTGTNNQSVAVTKPSSDSLHATGKTAGEMVAKNETVKVIPVKNKKATELASNNFKRQSITEEKGMPQKAESKIEPVEIAENNPKPVSHPDPSIEASKLEPARPAVVTTPSTEVQSINYVALHIAESAGTPEDGGFYPLENTSKKPRMRGFFRKVSRVFEKTANAGQEDGKSSILIGGFQIAAK